MSPELGIVLFVALLLGLAAAWLINHALRARPGTAEAGNVAPGAKRGSQPSPEELAALVGQDGFWACLTCHSLNRREANHCYACHAAKSSPGPPKPDAPPAGRRVPAAARRSPRYPGDAGGTAMAGGTTLAGGTAMAGGTTLAGTTVPGATTVARSATVAVAAAGRVRGPVAGSAVAAGQSGPAAGSAVAAASESRPAASESRPAAESADPAAIVLGRDPGPGSSGARLALSGVPVCPFLGFRDDPSTRCDFPDPRNLCHATSNRGATSFASRRRFAIGMARSAQSKPIDAAHQKSRCLSPTHVQCARYPAAQPVAAERSS